MGRFPDEPTRVGGSVSPTDLHSSRPSAPPPAPAGAESGNPGRSGGRTDGSIYFATRNRAPATGSPPAGEIPATWAHLVRLPNPAVWPGLAPGPGTSPPQNAASCGTLRHPRPSGDTDLGSGAHAAARKHLIMAVSRGLIYVPGTHRDDAATVQSAPASSHPTVRLRRA